MFNIIYPYEGKVTEKQIRIWLADALANEELDSDYDNCNPLTCSIYWAIQGLENTGKFTFGRQSPINTMSVLDF